MKIIAFYLPQFHEIPENNYWWGQGFTEWTNVKKSKKLFYNHYQPRVPLNNNYYSLKNLDTIRWQAELAKKYNIYGFCFYHYWFNGKLLLERPMEILLENKDIDVKFCISWANEEWTNGWVSNDNKILMKQNFGDRKDWENHFQYFLKFFLDPRYIYEDGKPLLIIYFPSIIHEIEEMLSFWRKRASDYGLKGIHFLYQKAQYHFDISKNKSIFDGGIEFQPGYQDLNRKNKIRRQFESFSFQFLRFVKSKLHLSTSYRVPKLLKLSYDKAWDNILNSKPSGSHMYPGAFVDWDNTPRKGRRGSVYVGSNPIKFEIYLTKYLNKIEREYKKDLVFLFAWNEWGESGYLEPDSKFKYQYLQAVKNALITSKKDSKNVT
jgi:hypothetical protein